MKVVKNLVIAIVFVGLLLALLVPISYAVRPMSETRNRITGFYAEEEESLDIVAVGSSALYRYINNPVLWGEYGWTSYNYAFAGLNIYLTEYLIDEVERTQSPKLYILDARKFLMKNDDEINLQRAQSPIINMKYTPSRVQLINRVTDDPIDRLNYYFDLSFYHKSWKELDSESWRYADNEKIHYLKGWRVIDTVLPFKKPKVANVTEEKPLYEGAEEELYELMQKCKDENIEILFVSTPWNMTKKLQKKSNYMKRIVEEYGFHYLDMNLAYDEMELDFSNDFYNKKHTNAWGSEKVARYLGDYIKETYDFEVTHEKSVEDSWNQTWNLYQEKMAEIAK